MFNIDEFICFKTVFAKRRVFYSRIERNKIWEIYFNFECPKRFIENIQQVGHILLKINGYCLGINYSFRRINVLNREMRVSIIVNLINRVANRMYYADQKVR